MLNRPEEAAGHRRMNCPPSPADGQADRGAAGELGDRLEQQEPPRSACAGVGAALGEGDDEDDDGRVVEAGLGLEHAR